MGVVHPHLPRGDSQYPEALFTETLKLPVDPFERRFIQGPQTGLSIQPIADRQSQDVFGRSLDHEQSGRPVVKEYRYPAALEVERHFIDLAPAAHVDFCVLQDGDIQGAS